MIEEDDDSLEPGGHDETLDERAEDTAAPEIRRPLKQRRALIEFAGVRILIVDLSTDQFGHFGYELMMAAQRADELSAMLYAFSSLRTPNPGLLRLRSLRCRVLHGIPLLDRLLGPLARRLWRRCHLDLEAQRGPLEQHLAEARERLATALAEREVWSEWQKRLRKRLRPQRLREWARERERSSKRAALERKRERARAAVAAAEQALTFLVEDPGRLAPWPASRQQDWMLPRRAKRLRRRARRAQVRAPAYLARRTISETTEFRFTPGDTRRCRRLARQLGIADDAKLAAVHVREGGFKAGREIDRKGGPRRDWVRNADIATYLPAFETMVAAGYTVVRIGDSSMTPVALPGVVDLACSPKRTPLLELYLLSRSRFLVGTESGPNHISYMFGTPTLITNATDIIGSYPVRSFDRYLLKRVRDLESGLLLDLDGLLSARHYGQFRNTDHFEYLDCTPGEIEAAVAEMIEVVEGRAPPASPAQLAFHERCLAASLELAAIQAYVGKWGDDGGFIGRGLVSQAVVGMLGLEGAVPGDATVVGALQSCQNPQEAATED